MLGKYWEKLAIQPNDLRSTGLKKKKGWGNTQKLKTPNHLRAGLKSKQRWDQGEKARDQKKSRTVRKEDDENGKA